MNDDCVCDVSHRYGVGCLCFLIDPKGSNQVFSFRYGVDLQTISLVGMLPDRRNVNPDLMLPLIRAIAFSTSDRSFLAWFYHLLRRSVP